MNGIPAFSIFSAISEVFVTLGVLYSVISAIRGKPLQWKLLGLVLAFEGAVNVIYMANRASHADKSSDLTTGMKLFFAGHGILSLFMYLALLVLFLLAVKDFKEDKAVWFHRHQSWSWVLVGFWMISVTSGEAIFFMQYGDRLLGDGPAESTAAVVHPGDVDPSFAQPANPDEGDDGEVGDEPATPPSPTAASLPGAPEADPG